MTTVYWPFSPNIINYGYGYPPGYGGYHNGIDFPVPQGTELRATISGTIRNNDAGVRDGAGVDITSQDGVIARMWHVSKFLVPNGSYVEAGQVVALSGGNPGTWGAGNATGAHLHWGTAIGRKGNDYNWVDPVTLNPINFGNTPQPQPNKRKEEPKMMLCHRPLTDGSLLFLLFGDNFYLEFTGQEAANAFSAQIGSASAPVSESFFDKVRAEVEAGRK